MTRMNGQTKIIVATACCLALVDIGVRLLAPTPFNSNCSTCPPLTLGNGVVRARAIELVDADNNVRGLWNTDENGEPALWMYDRNGGSTRIGLNGDNGGVHFEMHRNGIFTETMTTGTSFVHAPREVIYAQGVQVQGQTEATDDNALPLPIAPTDR